MTEKTYTIEQTKKAGQLFRKWVQIHFEKALHNFENPFGEIDVTDAMLSIFPTKFEVTTVEELIEKRETYAKEKMAEFVEIVKLAMKPEKETQVPEKEEKKQ